MQHKQTTKKQGYRALLKFIDDFARSQGYTPTVREISEGTDGASTSVVVYRLKQLQEAGYIHRKERGARSISITPAGHALLGRPARFDPAKIEDAILTHLEAENGEMRALLNEVYLISEDGFRVPDETLARIAKYVEAEHA